MERDTNDPIDDQSPPSRIGGRGRERGRLPVAAGGVFRDGSGGRVGAVVDIFTIDVWDAGEGAAVFATRVALLQPVELDLCEVLESPSGGLSAQDVLACSFSMRPMVVIVDEDNDIAAVNRWTLACV
jgi:hypothetical protein